MTNTTITDAKAMAESINAENEFAKAKVWSVKNDDGTVKKVRVYLAKGYIELKDDNGANISAVGGHFFTEAQSALEKTGYTRVYG